MLNYDQCPLKFHSSSPGSLASLSKSLSNFIDATDSDGKMDNKLQCLESTESQIKTGTSDCLSDVTGKSFSN